MYLGQHGRTGGPPSEVWSMTCEDGWASGMGWLAVLPPPPPFPPPPLLLLLLLLLPSLPSSFLSFLLFSDQPRQGAGAGAGGKGPGPATAVRLGRTGVAT